MVMFIDPDSGAHYSVVRTPDGQLTKTTVLPDGRTLTTALKGAEPEPPSKGPRPARVCEHCGLETPDDGEACYECGAPSPEQEDSVRKRQRAIEDAEVAEYVRLAQHGDSQMSRLGMDLLIRYVGPLRAADLVAETPRRDR
ncbi:hypothetical protein [Sinomonas soli]